MKKLSKLFLSLAMVFSLLMNFENTHAEVYSGICGDQVTWELDSTTGILTISGQGEMYDYAAYDEDFAPWNDDRELIKSVIIGEGITRVGNNDFVNCYYITEVKLPETLKEIGNKAFSYCGSLISIQIPASVTSIGVEVLEGCSDLASIQVDEKNEVYDSRNNCNAIILTEENRVIQGCQNSTIPEGIWEIGSYAFEGCTSLTEIVIPDTVYSIDDYAFLDCEGLKNIQISNQLQQLGRYAFYLCKSLTSIELPDTLIYLGFSAFGDCYALKSVKLSNQLTEIPTMTFYQCTSLTEIEIPDQVTTIYYQAFAGCSSLTDISIPSSVTEIYDTAFQYDSNVTIHCHQDGYVEQFAISHGIPYASAHFYQLVSDSATCTQEGVLTYKCSDCEKSYTQPSPAKGHTIPANVTTKTTAATCTKAGSVTETYTCPVCNKKITNKTTIPALGHNLTNITTVEATYSKAGYTSGYCTNCKKTIKVTIPKLVSVSISKCSIIITQLGENKLDVEVIDPNGNIVDPECYTVSYPATLTVGKTVTVKITGVTAKGYSSSKSIKIKIMM